MEVQLLSAADSEFKSRRFRRKGGLRNNFLKCCKWSPDGSCILTNSDDGVLRIFATPTKIHQRFYKEPLAEVASESANHDVIDSAFPQPAETVIESNSGDILTVESQPQSNTEEISESLKADESGQNLQLHAGVRIRLRTQVYDVAWYPVMSYAFPETCCFAVAAFDSPIVLLDAYSGESRATYRAFNQLDELVPLYSVAFNSSGSGIFAGAQKTHRRFDLARPGNDSEQVPRVGAKYIQGGIHSCFAFHNNLGCYAVGSFNQTVGLYSEATYELVCPLLNGHRAGVTQVRFSADGHRLWTGARAQDGRVLCWDLRNLDQPLCRAAYPREIRTNQRCLFDITSDAKYLAVGNRNGRVFLYELDELAKASDEANVSFESDADERVIPKPSFEFSAHSDMVNSISAHPFYAQVLATTSGQRHEVQRFASATGKRKASETECKQQQDCSAESSDSETESESSADECESSNDNLSIENSLKMWCLATANVTDLEKPSENEVVLSE